MDLFTPLWNPNGITGEEELEIIFQLSKVQSFPSIQVHKCYFVVSVPLAPGQYYWTIRRNNNLTLFTESNAEHYET